MKADFVYLFISTFFFSFLFMSLIQPISRKIGLVDVPNERKLHSGNVPLIGGVSLYISIFTSIILFFDWQFNHIVYFICASMIIILGVLDDKYDLSVKVRILVQTLVSLVMIYAAGLQIDTLGKIIGDTDLSLGYLGPILSIIIVIGMINAFNMVDGIDGLVGSLSLITFSTCAVFLASVENNWWAIAVVFVISLSVYLMYNLGWPIKKLGKIFMGDAGSMLIGFSIVWLLLESIKGSGDSEAIRPVTALYLTAIPIMDMAAIMYRRIRKGKSPFKADRQHLHHIFERAGFSRKQTLVFISFAALIFTVIGSLGEYYHISESIMFYSFLVVFFIYNYVLTHIWLILKYFRRFRTVEKN